MSIAPVVSASSIGLIVDESGDRIVLEEDLQEQQELADQLVSAAFLGDLASVKALANGRVDVNQTDGNGYTALQLACTAGRTDCARHLLAKGADINAKGNGGSTPLHAGARNGHVDVLQLLLSIPKIDVNAVAKDGRTALHAAAEHDHSETAQLLIEAGVDVERKDRSGQTALQVACAAVGGAGSATARILSAQENLSGLYRGRYRLTQRHERRERSMSVAQDAPGCQVQARFGEDTATGDSVALIFSETRADWERAYEVHTRLSVMPPPTPAQGMPPAMPSAGRIIDSFEDPTRPLPHCIVVDGWDETLADYLDTRAGRLARNEAVYIAEGVLRSLHNIHAVNLVHTLVCPSTIGRAWDGSWRLLDLHLARGNGDDAATALLPPVHHLTCCPPELLAYQKAAAERAFERSAGGKIAIDPDIDDPDGQASAERDPADLCTAQVDLWMFGCVLCELILGVPLTHVDAEELWQRPPKPKLHPWQVEAQAAARDARKAEEAAEYVKQQVTAGHLVLDENDDVMTGAVSLPPMPETPEEPALYRLPAYLAPGGEAGLDRLSYTLINGLLGLPSGAPRSGLVEPKRLLPLEALQHKFFMGGVPRLVSSAAKAKQLQLDFEGEEDEDEIHPDDVDAVPPPTSHEQEVKDGRRKPVRTLDEKGNLVTQVWRWSPEERRWTTAKQSRPVLPVVPVPQPMPDGSPSETPTINMAGSTVGTFGMGGEVDWIRRLRRDQHLPYPTMWAILPADPNPHLEPQLDEMGATPEAGMEMGEGGSAEGAKGLNPLPSKWAKLEGWGRQSFNLHLMCEWEHGHFIHERYGYPIFKPRETLARLAPLYQKLLTELSGPPDLLAKCPHHIPYEKIRADLGIEKDDYRLPFRKFDTEAFMRSCCDQAFDPSMHITGSPGWAMAKSNAREWQKARDATVNLSVDGEGSVNIALGKPVQVSSVFVEDGQEYGGEKAVNGSKDGWENRWVCRKDDETPWIEVDLQGIFMLRAISFWLAPVPISSYKIECRVGYGEWQEIATVEDNDQLEGLHDQFELILADTVRMVAYERIKLYELEVWGERHDVERGDVLRSLEWSQKFFAAVDPVGQYGNLYRCALANGEHRWLCPYHAAHAKGEVELARPPPLRTVGELATERVLKIAKAAEAAKRLGQEAARAAGELELGAGDGIDVKRKKAEAAESAAEVSGPSSAGSTARSAASSTGGYHGDADVVYSDGVQAADENSDNATDSRRSTSCTIQ